MVGPCPGEIDCGADFDEQAPDQCVQTKREARLAAVEDPGADDRPKGKVRGNNGELEHEIAPGEWVTAVYHNHIRGQLLNLADQNGRYDFERKRGRDVHDRTSFLQSQKSWGADPNSWLNIPDRVLHRRERNGYVGRQGEIPIMRDWIGRIVLDIDNHPVYAYPDLPEVLSSEVEGWFVEVVSRLDSRIEKKDIRARMPWQILKSDDTYKTLCTLSAIGNRQSRFRREFGLFSWTKRSGSEAIDNFNRARLTQEDVDNNTTRSMQPLSKEEQKQGSAANKGLFDNRAGHRALTEEERENRKNKASKQKLGQMGNPVQRCNAEQHKETGYFDQRVAVPSTWGAIDTLLVEAQYTGTHGLPQPSMDSMTHTSDYQVGTFQRGVPKHSYVPPQSKRPLDEETEDQQDGNPAKRQRLEDTARNALAIATQVAYNHGSPPPIDLRYVRPRDADEANEIGEALTPTKKALISFAGDAKIMHEFDMNPWESYVEQWAAIQTAFCGLYLSDTSPPPNLIHRDAWYFDFRNWMTAGFSHEGLGGH